jgi:large subunit ribosomal protein L21
MSDSRIIPPVWQSPHTFAVIPVFPKNSRGGQKNLAPHGSPWCSPRPPTGAVEPFPHTAMAYAVIKTGGKQYRVQEGTKFDVEKLEAAVDSEIKFDALIVGEGATVKIGAPTVEGASVTARVLSQYRGPKGVAFKFKRRKGFHKTKGFRRSLTKLEITSIAG